MKKERDRASIIKSWLRKKPKDHHDSRSQRDPYWRLRALGYPHSYAIRALRGEGVKLETVELPNSEEIAKQYGIDIEDLIGTVHGQETTEIQAVITMRPEFLTEQSVEEAAPLATEYSISDRFKVPGLVLRIRPSGHKSYVLYYRVHGDKKTRKKKIATAGAVTLENARAIAREFMYSVYVAKSKEQVEMEELEADRRALRAAEKKKRADERRGENSNIGEPPPGVAFKGWR
jgi:hypothetical protein